MEAFGKTIRLFLVEGNTNGLITAELSNWTGKGLKVPRIKVKEYASRDEFKGPGLYILFGKSDTNEDAAYIGEGEPVIDRLTSHVAKKEFWNEVIVFVSKDKYLNKASIKYLENRLHQIAQKADRYKVDNINTPTQSGVSEAEQAELEEFLSNIKSLTSTLGHKIFEELNETINKKNVEASRFYCTNSSGVNAFGSPSTEGFIVFTNSIFSANQHPSLSESIRREKAKMIEEGFLVSEGEYCHLKRDYTFSSSSRAAAMILGRSASGPIEWRTDKGIQLKQFESEK